MIRGVTVSYTQLDVYKRQVQDEFRDILEELDRAGKMVAEEDTESNESEEMCIRDRMMIPMSCIPSAILSISS